MEKNDRDRRTDTGYTHMHGVLAYIQTYSTSVDASSYQIICAQLKFKYRRKEQFERLRQ